MSFIIFEHFADVRQQTAWNLCAETTVLDILGGGFFDVLGRANVGVLEMRFPVAEGKRAQHAVAIEPVTILLPADALPSWAVAEGGTLKICGYLALDVLTVVSDYAG